MRCKMHDIVHDFVQFITKKECLITEAEGANREIEVLGSKVRHVTLTSVADSPTLCSVTSNCCRNLRTLTIVHLNIDTVYAISQFKCLRTINLSQSSIKELPEEIGELIHLRHIDLSRSQNLVKLPDTICGLCNLYTLDLRRCNSLKKLPGNMGKWISLKHLYVGLSGLEYLPKGIGSLTNLHTLDVCPIVSIDNGEAFQAGDLRTLNQLHGSLTVRILGKVKDGSQVSEAHLRDKKQLFHLVLSFGEGRDELGQSSVRIMNALQQHDDLESFVIYGYVGSTWPNWLMSLNKLRFLTLQDNSACELPPLGRLPFLEKLYVWGMSGVRNIGGEFLGAEEDDQTSSPFKSSSSVLFPKLKRLYFNNMSSWKDWEGVKGWNEVDSEISIMPCLSSLKIGQCYALETLPDFLCKIPLQTLSIFVCPKLAERCKEGSGEEWHKISHIPNIKILNMPSMANRHIIKDIAEGINETAGTRDLSGI